MKGTHVLVLALIAVGALFLFHNWQSHGGWAGVRQGTGLNGRMMAP